MFPRGNAEPRPGDPGASGRENEPAPRWLTAVGLAIVFTLVAALARFAIDLLGVVFLIIVVGFSLRAISDWITETDTVSGWTIGAVALGLAGTVLVGMWLFGSSSLNRGASVAGRLPAPVVTTIGWLESRGWGQRVLLHAGDGEPAPVRASRGGGTAPASSGGSAMAAAPDDGPTFSLRKPSARALAGAGGRSRGGDTREPGAAEASTLPASPPAARDAVQPAREPAPPAPEPPRQFPTVTTLASRYDSVRVGTSVRFTATVEAVGGSSLPTGTVVFYGNDEVLGRVRLRATPDGAVAVLSTLDLAMGVHEIHAEYTGGDGFASSRSAGVRQVVRRQ